MVLKSTSNGGRTLLIAREPLTTALFVGANWALGAGGVVFFGAVMSGVPISWAVGAAAAVASAFLVRAAWIQVVVTTSGVRVRNLVRSYTFSWSEVAGFEHGKPIHIGGRPYDNLLTLRLNSGARIRALGTVTLTSSRLESTRKELRTLVRSHRRGASPFARRDSRTTRDR